MKTKLVINKQRKVVSSDNATVKLSLSEINLLLFLSEHEGEFVTKAQLLKAGWKQRIVTESSAVMAISNLRKALSKLLDSEQEGIVTGHDEGGMVIYGLESSLLDVEEASVSLRPPMQLNFRWLPKRASAMVVLIICVITVNYYVLL